MLIIPLQIIKMLIIPSDSVQSLSKSQNSFYRSRKIHTESQGLQIAETIFWKEVESCRSHATWS